MKLIDLVLKAKRMGLTYLTVDSDGVCSGFIIKPYFDGGLNLVGDYTVVWCGRSIVLLGTYDGIENIDTREYIININDLTL